MGCEDDSNVWIYEGPTSRSPVGASGWACAANSKYHPAPTLSFGTCRDLQEGDVVTIIKLNEEVEVEATDCNVMLELEQQRVIHTNKKKLRYSMY